MVNIEGLTKAEVFMVLYNNAMPRDKIVDLSMAVNIVDRSFYTNGCKLLFNEIGGKKLYLDLVPKDIDTTAYDKVNAGEEGYTAEYAISEYRKRKIIQEIISK